MPIRFYEQPMVAPNASNDHSGSQQPNNSTPAKPVQQKYIEYTGKEDVMITIRILKDTRGLLNILADRANLSLNEYVQRRLGIFRKYSSDRTKTDCIIYEE
jgi:hypothetical protein